MPKRSRTTYNGLLQVTIGFYSDIYMKAIKRAKGEKLPLSRYVNKKLNQIMLIEEILTPEEFTLLLLRAEEHRLTKIYEHETS